MKKNNTPKNKFKMLLAILTAIALLIIVLFLAAFGMLQWAQEYGLVGTPGEKITLENLSDRYRRDRICRRRIPGDERYRIHPDGILHGRILR